MTSRKKTKHNNDTAYGKDQQATFQPECDETDPQEYQSGKGVVDTDKYSVDKK